MLYLIFIPILFWLMNLTGYIDLVYSIFDQKDVGNSVRLDQLNYLVNDLTLLGHGAGALIKNYRYGYSVELVYVNVIHKYGLMSVFIFLGFALTFIKLFITFKTSVFLTAILFSFMMYVVPALGNAILFAPLSVFLHVTVLYTISCLEKTKKPNLNYQ